MTMHPMTFQCSASFADDMPDVHFTARTKGYISDGPYA